MEKDYIVEHEGIRYKFSICRPLENTTCDPYAGVCDISTGTSYGVAHRFMIWEESIGPLTFYIFGDVCPFNDRYASTVIRFACGTDLSIIMEKVECDVSIHFFTDIVCKKEVFPKNALFVHINVI